LLTKLSAKLQIDMDKSIYFYSKFLHLSGRTLDWKVEPRLDLGGYGAS